MSVPGIHDFSHYAGDTLEQGVRINVRNEDGSHSPADLTGWTVAAKLRTARTKVAVAGLSATLANQSTDPGVVLLKATSATTATWTTGPSLVYELEMTRASDGFVRTVLSGRIFVRDQVPA